MKRIAIAAACAALAGMLPSGASAQSAFQGFHAGVNVGPTMSDIRTTDSVGGSFSTTPGFDGNIAAQGFVGGGSLGYMFNFSQGWLVDLEGMVDYSSSSSNYCAFGMCGGRLQQGLGYGGAASLGYMISRYDAIYAKAGYELQEFQVQGLQMPQFGIGVPGGSKYLGGIELGAGNRWAIDNAWSVKVEYLYTMFGNATIGGVDVKPDSQSVRLGVDYRFW